MGPDDRDLSCLKVKTNLALGRSAPFPQLDREERPRLFPALEYLLDREARTFRRRDADGRHRSRALGGPGLILSTSLPRPGACDADVMKTIERLKGEKMGVLVVEQNVRSVLGVCDRVYVVQQGRVVHESSAEALLEDEETRTKLLGT
jgi:branched-chain amino acid transport system ATP-binding protein